MLIKKNIYISKTHKLTFKCWFMETSSNNKMAHKNTAGKRFRMINCTIKYWTGNRDHYSYD